MSPEEQAVRLALLDKTPEEQEFYRNIMQTTLDNFKEQYSQYDENHQELYVAALAIAFTKFAETVN